MQPPLCPGHREASVIRTVKEGGENQGEASSTASCLCTQAMSASKLEGGHQVAVFVMLLHSM